MAFVTLLILAYGPLNWSFPWWVWVIALFTSSAPTVNNYIRVRRRE